MASSGNFCTMNPLAKSSSATLSNGNLYLNSHSYPSNILGTMGVASGKWYFEARCTDNYGAYDSFGVIVSDNYTYPSNVGNSITESISWHQLDTVRINGSDQGTTSPSLYNTATKIVGCALDLDNNKVYFHGNNTYVNSHNPNTGSGGFSIPSTMQGKHFLPLMGTNAVGAAALRRANFGQDSSFGGDETAQGNADGNGHGDFYYAPPTGFLAMCSANLPIDSDIDPAQTNSDFIGGKHFGIVTYTGNSTTGQSITGLGFKPDVIWAKCSSHSQNNQVYHSQVLNSRSPTPTPFMFQMDTTSRIDDQAQGNNNPIISSFDTDGFTLGTSGSGPNDNGREYVAWCWRAKGATTTSNSDGDRTSTIQVNPDIGFSTGTYTGNLTSSGTATVGHGLGKAPEMIISFRSDGNSQRMLRHSGLTSEDYMLQVETTGAEVSKAHNGNMSAPNATTFDTNYTDGVNTNGHTFLFMAWTSIDGFSKFGSYVGNGNADGAFVYTGFRPRMIMIRRYTGTDSLFIYDSARSPSNIMGNFLQWNDSAAQTGSNLIDFLSNGFKLRSTSASQNPSGTKIIFAAWADVPFKYNNTF